MDFPDDAGNGDVSRSRRTTKCAKVMKTGGGPGDSLAAGLGWIHLRRYPAGVSNARADEAELHYTVVNAGVSGDTKRGRVESNQLCY